MHSIFNHRVWAETLPQLTITVNLVPMTLKCALGDADKHRK